MCDMCDFADLDAFYIQYDWDIGLQGYDLWYVCLRWDRGVINDAVVSPRLWLHDVNCEVGGAPRTELASWVARLVLGRLEEKVQSPIWPRQATPLHLLALMKAAKLPWVNWKIMNKDVLYITSAEIHNRLHLTPPPNKSKVFTLRFQFLFALEMSARPLSSIQSHACCHF